MKQSVTHCIQHRWGNKYSRSLAVGEGTTNLQSSQSRPSPPPWAQWGYQQWLNQVGSSITNFSPIMWGHPVEPAIRVTNIGIGPIKRVTNVGTTMFLTSLEVIMITRELSLNQNRPVSFKIPGLYRPWFWSRKVVSWWRESFETAYRLPTSKKFPNGNSPLMAELQIWTSVLKGCRVCSMKPISFPSKNKHLWWTDRWDYAYTCSSARFSVHRNSLW